MLKTTITSLLTLLYCCHAESVLRPVFNELCFNLESFNPAFASCLLMVSTFLPTGAVVSAMRHWPSDKQQQQQQQHTLAACLRFKIMLDKGDYPMSSLQIKFCCRLRHCSKAWYLPAATAWMI